MAFDTIVEVQSNYESKCSLNADKGLGLTNYMQLPVDQYVCIKMPLDATLSRIDGNRFNLTVPPVRFFNLDVSPTMICRVTQSNEAVLIESSECTLRGSPFVEGLNGCFKMLIKTSFKWIDTPSRRSILSNSNIYVEVDPPPPFKYFGKTILERTGSIALSIALRQIENAFVSSLSRDYEKWVTDKQYRAQRAGRFSTKHTPTSNEGHHNHHHSTITSTSLSSSSSLTSFTSTTTDTSRSSEAVVAENQSKSQIQSPTNSVSMAMTMTKNTTKVGESIEVSNKLSSLAASTSSNVNNGAISANGDMDMNANLNVPNSPEDEEFLKSVLSNHDTTPEVLTDDMCLLPGEPIIRIEEAPSNSRRIYSGIDILASVDDVWKVLTNYERLQDVVPSLVKNELLFRYPDGGARLSQVGAAKVLPGITFTAKTVLDVRIYNEKNPLPKEAIANYVYDKPSSGSDSSNNGEWHLTSKNQPLRRGVYPRPLAISSLPHRDITMQNVPGEGDFDHYQGLWRIQALPFCAPENSVATRLTYAVEIKPKGFLPVRLIEGRIASDLKKNLEAIREFVEADRAVKQKSQQIIVESSKITTPIKNIFIEKAKSSNYDNDNGRDNGNTNPISSSVMIENKSMMKPIMETEKVEVEDDQFINATTQTYLQDFGEISTASKTKVINQNMESLESKVDNSLTVDESSTNTNSNNQPSNNVEKPFSFRRMIKNTLGFDMSWSNEFEKSPSESSTTESVVNDSNSINHQMPSSSSSSSFEQQQVMISSPSATTATTATAVAITTTTSLVNGNRPKDSESIAALIKSNENLIERVNYLENELSRVKEIIDKLQKQTSRQ